MVRAKAPTMRRKIFSILFIYLHILLLPGRLANSAPVRLKFASLLERFPATSDRNLAVAKYGVCQDNYDTVEMLIRRGSNSSSGSGVIGEEIRSRFRASNLLGTNSGRAEGNRQLIGHGTQGTEKIDRRRGGIGTSCQFQHHLHHRRRHHHHYLPILLTLVTLTTLNTPCEARSVSLVDEGSNSGGIIVPNKLGPDEETWRSRPNAPANPMSPSQELQSLFREAAVPGAAIPYSHRLSLPPRRRIFPQKTNLQQEGSLKDELVWLEESYEGPEKLQSIRFQPHQDILVPPVPSADKKVITESLTATRSEELKELSSQIPISQPLADSSAPTAPISDNVKNPSPTTAAEHEMRPVTELKMGTTVKDGPKGNDGPSGLSQPIRFQASPFLVSPAIAPEVQDQFSGSKVGPPLSLLEELGTTF